MQSKDKMQNSTFPHIWFILLINTKSGGGWGKRYLQLKKHQFFFEYKKQSFVHVKLIDLFDHQKKRIQLEKAKQLQKDNKNDVRVIICGGDGTVIWGIEECLKAGLNFQQLLIACLPIGTGNDFSRTIGWGSSPIQFKQGNILPLKKRIIEWMNSTVTKYDLWEVEISVYQKGQIYVAKNGQDFLTNKKNHKTGFANYVGVGIDGRVSYNFEKNRKSTKLMNYTVYTCLACYLCCKSIPELNQSFQTFEEGQRYSSNVNESPKFLKQQNIDESINQPLQQNDSGRESKKIGLKKGYHGLICLNSTSYMGGTMDAWDTSRIGCTQKSITFGEQSFNDGKVQFVGFQNEIILGLQRFFHTGARVAQGEGPFVMQFKQQSMDIANYVQIDGEALMIKGIKQVIIRRHATIPSVRIMMKSGK